MTYWYISFAEPGRFLGATVVEAPDAYTACALAALLGVNPGGEAMVWELPDIDDEYRWMVGRLCSEREIADRHGGCENLAGEVLRGTRH